MKVFWGAGKVLTLAFWLVVLVSLAVELPNPFDVLLKLVGSLLLLMHVLELGFFNNDLRGRAHPVRDALQVMLFGMFHLQSFSRPSLGVNHA